MLRRAIERALTGPEVLEQLVYPIVFLYSGSNSKVCLSGATSNLVDVRVVVHQVSTQSPHLYALVLEGVSRYKRKRVVWNMVYADDLVLTRETTHYLECMLIPSKAAM